MMTIDQQLPDVAQISQRIIVNCNRPSPRTNNAVIKDDGGAIGLTEDPTALWRWMIAGPEVSRLVTRYEEVAGT